MDYRLDGWMAKRQMEENKGWEKGLPYLCRGQGRGSLRGFELIRLLFWFGVSVGILEAPGECVALKH